MDNNLDKLLLNLDDEIERKCFEMKKQKSEKIMALLFLVACLAVIIVPISLILLGVSIGEIILSSAIFLGLSFLLLTPFLLNNHLGGI